MSKFKFYISLNIKKNVSLCELDQKPEGDDLFNFAQILADLNSDGKILKRFTMENLAFNSSRGGWAIINTSGLEEIELSPERIAIEFEEMFQSWGNYVIPVLGGYARKGYQVIDPRYPGFTDAVLKLLLGNNITATPKPRHLKFDFVFLLSTNDIKIDYDKMEVEKLSSSSDLGWNDIYIITSLLTLSISGINPINLFNHFYKYSQSNFIKALKNKYSYEKITFENSYLVNSFLDLVIKAGNSPVGFENEVFIKEVFLKISNLNTKNQQILYDSIYDGLNYLARQMDVRGRIRDSMQIIQAALLFFQNEATIIDELEDRLCRVEFDQSLLSWKDLKFDDMSDPDLFFEYICCLSSLTIAEGLYFEESVELVKKGIKSNFLWTSLNRSIKRQRNFICLCHLNIINGSIPSNFQDSFFILVKNVISHYLLVLKRHFKTVSYCTENNIKTSYFFSWSNSGKEINEFIMRQETKIGQSLYKELQDNGLNKESKRLIGDLYVLINS